MSLASQFEKVFLTASFLATVLLLWRLLSERLHSKYQYLTAYLIFQLAITGVSFFVPTRSSFYGLLYILTAPAEWALYFMMVREAYTTILAEHNGIATAGKRAFTGAIVVATIASLATILPDLNAARLDRLHFRVDLILAGARAVLTTIVFFLLLITAFIAWFPVSAARNAVYCGIGYSFFFLTKAAVLVARNSGNQDYTRWFSVVNLLTATLVLSLLAWKLNTSEGEETINIGEAWKHGDPEDLTRRLGSINNALLKTSRR